MYLIKLLEELFDITVTKIQIFSYDSLILSIIISEQADYFNEVEAENYKLELFYKSTKRLNDKQLEQIKLILLSCATTFTNITINDITYLLNNIINNDSIEQTLNNTIKKLTEEQDIYSAGLYYLNNKLMQLRGLIYYSNNKTTMDSINFKKEIVELNKRSEFSDIIFFEQIKEINSLNNHLFPFKNYGIGIYTKNGPIGLLVISTKDNNITHINNLLNIYSKILSITFTVKSLIQRYKFAVDDLEFFKNNLFYNNNLINLGKLTATIAHELKNPLVSIGGFTNRVLKLNKDEKLNGYLNIIKNEVNRMENLINDLLLYSKAIKLDISEVNVLSLVEEATTILYEKIREKDVDVQINIKRDETLKIDKNKILQVLLNLINNSLDALCNETNNTIKINLETNTNFKILEIIDNGCGIPKSDIAKLFTPFYTTKESGTGLGLPICKKIMEAHDGDIKIFSDNNQTKIQLFFKRGEL
ncbi:conserved hypothetical protein [Deferribacter desulfuricans SSM1]|uniref:histidine kinase n=1 Tax=Deferribacter desulfuricans (strain DSM 14783 / JCM 11476 / NBRC 101012 / SSM1) TaxID=639282 RepID=D3PAH5_DEFDS|nr:HAMP domain-containing sensor histidine kinase [Deferribacter desulfuricans]BAI79598.1 conserved hypothetical protein [Deferribacter desulfuricans SSM1]